MTLFGPTHAIVVLTVFVIAGLCIREGRRNCTWPRVLLAFLCLTVYPLNLLAYGTLEFELPLENILPFHLCDFAALTAGFAILTRKPLLCELTYCWGLAATLQALITPNLPYPPGHPVFWSFFIHHGAVVVVALYLPLAMSWKPRPGVVPRILLWNQVYFFPALLVNHLLGTNFGFLARKPVGNSLLDPLGDWPVYLIWLQILAAILMILLLLPFRKSINIWRSSRNALSQDS